MPVGDGIAIPNTELWLVDEQDRRLGPGEVGQLVTAGPRDGYLPPDILQSLTRISGRH